MNAIRRWAEEHPWTVGLCAVLGMCALADTVLWFRLAAERQRLDRHRLIVSEMERLAAEYAVLEQRVESEEPPQFMAAGMGLSPAIVEKVAREAGITDRITSTTQTEARHGDGLREQMVVLSLEGVRREDLARFVFAVEGLDPAIRTKELRLSASRKAPRLVDARVTFSAYEAATTVSR